MHLTTPPIGTVSVLNLSARNPGAPAASIRDAVARIHATGQSRIVLNMAELEYMDSAGLGDLVACNTRATQGGRPLKLAALTRRMQDLLRTTRLITTFDIYDTLEAALESFTDKTP